MLNTLRAAVLGVIAGALLCVLVFPKGPALSVAFIGFVLFLLIEWLLLRWRD